ncbi:Glycerol kinase [Venturia nashicola]|uniref:Glycerol kinase n=1 Tax=Venturia nashicola TaxID=86259 RepID=A0A4Z1NR93_9PEZI|nr:Glycerol kinase [Venturia nashicola]TLD15075.1 Glycerol kinase [Venturia nashicola]
MTSIQNKTETQLRDERIEANTKIIGGDLDYRFDLIGSGDPSFFQIVVKKELAHKSESLTHTRFCKGSEQAWDELDRLLGAWARQRQSGQDMTEEERLDIFGNGLYVKDDENLRRFETSLEAIEKKDEQD